MEPVLISSFPRELYVEFSSTIRVDCSHCDRHYYGWSAIAFTSLAAHQLRGLCPERRLLLPLHSLRDFLPKVSIQQQLRHIFERRMSHIRSVVL